MFLTRIMSNLKVMKKEFSPINKIISRFKMRFHALGSTNVKSIH